MDDNLGANIMFMLDAIVDSDIEEPYPATINAALALVQFAWNSKIQESSITSEFYEVILRNSENINPSFWEELIRSSSEELIEILKKRKRFFFPDDRRLIRSCFYNMLGTITVEEDDEEGTAHIGR
jgi:hypothetical protein